MRAVSLLLLVAISGCGNQDRNWKETIPVTGQVFVGGQPAEGVMIEFHSEEGSDQEQPTFTQAITSKDGKFAATTYAADDGAPAGNYKLTFTWPEMDVVLADDGAILSVGDSTERNNSLDSDQFNGRYSYPEESEHSVSVVSGSPVNLGIIELK